MFLGGPCGGRNDFAGVIRMDNFGLARFRLRKKIRANIQRTAAMQRGVRNSEGVPPSRDVLVPFRWLSVVNLDPLFVPFEFSVQAILIPCVLSRHCLTLGFERDPPATPYPPARPFGHPAPLLIHELLRPQASALTTPQVPSLSRRRVSRTAAGDDGFLFVM